MRAILNAGLFGMVTGLTVLGGAISASAQVPLPLSVSGKEVRVSIELPGGIAAELTISFEQVVGLNPAALAVTATLVDPADPSLLLRLPSEVVTDPLTGLQTSVQQVTIPAAFPVLVRIDPTPTSALSFAGVASISLYTQNLQLNSLAPMALYKAHNGGPFSDIMVSEGRGSYRAGGSGGDFSEFLIVVDQRPIDTVIVGKFDALQSLLTAHGATMPATVADLLQARWSTAWSLYLSGGTVQAIAEMRAFSRDVVKHSGQEIPDVWGANCSGVANVAGLLRSGADTLRFSLDRKASR